MDLTLLVVLIPTTSIHQILLVMLLVLTQRHGETMLASALLLKKLMEMVVLPVPETIKPLIQIKMLAYAKMGMHLP